MKKTLVIGTRGSALALYQANLVQRLIADANPGLDIRQEIVQTVGDRDRKTALSKVSEVAQVQRGIFIKELEEALSEERVDIAVHSLKDMPSKVSADFEVPTFLPRADREDVLVSKYPGGIAGLPEGATVATGGVRRQCQLKTLRPDLKIVEMRGNVPTRLRKTADNSRIDATMLAAAGLSRLLYPVGGTLNTGSGSALYLHRLSTDLFLPPGGQGVIAIECLTKNSEVLAPILESLNCPQTAKECSAERAFLFELGASCDTPVSAMASTYNTGELELEVRYWEDGNPEPKIATCTGADPQEVAKAAVSAVQK